MSEIHHLYQAMSFIHCKVVFFGTKIRKCWKTEHSHLQLITINVVVGQKITRVSKVSLGQFTRVQFSWHFPQSTLSRELVHGRRTYIHCMYFESVLKQKLYFTIFKYFCCPRSFVPKQYSAKNLCSLQT